jgi:predicted RNA binding protein YcfA (HicA-like mRNA interferase family)
MSGKEMLRRFLLSGWSLLRQRGSHVIVGKDDLRAVIPLHKELKKGLESALLKVLRMQK